jgi:hypothetical protein
MVEAAGILQRLGDALALEDLAVQHFVGPGQFAGPFRHAGFEVAVRLAQGFLGALAIEDLGLQGDVGGVEFGGAQGDALLQFLLGPEQFHLGSAAGADFAMNDECDQTRAEHTKGCGSQAQPMGREESDGDEDAQRQGGAEGRLVGGVPMHPFKDTASAAGSGPALPHVNGGFARGLSGDFSEGKSSPAPVAAMGWANRPAKNSHWTRPHPADREGAVLKQTKVRGDAQCLQSGGVSVESGLDAPRLVA